MRFFRLSIFNLWLLLAIIIPGFSVAEPIGDGDITFYISHTGEWAHFHYRDASGQWLDGMDEKIARLMRSRKDNQTHRMDRRLIELADHLQDYFKAAVIEIISGYRSPEHNAELKHTGHNVANESYHMQGMAMDIHIDEISETALRDYLLSLKLGGVGYYGDKLMVHMDFGPVRAWQDGAFRENTTIGIFDQEEPLVQLRTQKLFYRQEDVMRLSGQNLESLTQASLEKFELGFWKQAKKLNYPQIPQKKPSEIAISELLEGSVLSPFGKYRIHLMFPAGGWQNSNEFYVKKR
jgi:uncharacterized protein YcbK (DUF882 family)